jgi:hypothetical protein
MNSDLVWRIGPGIVVERSAATLTMDEMAVVVLLAWPQSRDPTCLAMLPPERWIDPVVGIERRDDDIGDVSVALGVTRFAGRSNANLPKLRGKRRIENRRGMGVLHVGIAHLVCGTSAAPASHLGSAAVVAAGAVAAAGFFRLLMLIVISGTISKGRTPLNG